MAKKDFDFKKLLLQTGEKYLFGAAVGLLVLMLALGVYTAYTSGSPTVIAEDLNSKAATINNQLNTYTPPPGTIKEIDPALLSAGNPTNMPRDSYICKDLFFDTRVEDSKRQRIEVLTPEEFKVTAAFVPVRSLSIEKTGNDILVKVIEGGGPGVATRPGSAPNAAQMTRGGNNPRNINTLNTMGRMQRLAQPAPNTAIDDGSEQPVSGTNFNRGRGGIGPMGSRGGAGVNPLNMLGNSPRATMFQSQQSSVPGASSSNTNRDTQVRASFYKWDDLLKAGNVRMAESLKPYRMVIVSGTFPYKAQLEKFRDAMRYMTIWDMFRDPTSPFEFRGFNVQRAIVSSPAGPVPPEKQEWLPVDLNKDFRWVLLTAIDTVPEELDMQQVIVDGLCMPRPDLAIEHKYPPVKLEGIEKTLNEYREKIKTKRDLFNIIEKQRNSFENRLGTDPIFGTFNLDPQELTPEEMKFYGFNVQPGLSKNSPNNPNNPLYRGTTVPGQQPFGPAGVGARMPPLGAVPPVAPFGPNLANRGMPTMPGYAQQEEPWIPEYCLLRLIDVDIKAGHTYQYKLQVKMTNPSYKRKDLVAYDSLAEGQEIVGEWSKPVTAEVPPDKLYYLVDQVAEDKGQRRQVFAAKQITESALPNPDANRDKAYVQVHRFLFEERLSKDSETPHPVGDWSVANRVEVHRGEFLGRPKNVFVPIWNEEWEEFVIVDANTRVQRGASLRNSGIPIDFNTEAIVVDFEGGKGKYYYGKIKSIDDDAPLEMLIMTPEGKLEVRNSRVDTEDKEHKERYDTWQEWIQMVVSKEANERYKKMINQVRPMMNRGGPGMGGGQGTTGIDTN